MSECSVSSPPNPPDRCPSSQEPGGASFIPATILSLFGLELSLPCHDRWRLALPFYTHVSEREVEVLEEEVGGQGSRLLMTLAAQNKALVHGFTTVIAAHGRGSDSCGLPSGAWHGMMEPFLNRIELESKEDTY